MKDFENPRVRIYAALAIAVSAFYVIQADLFRPLWFDEALTVLSFVSLPSVKQIYLSYVIPNNHILFTVILRLWIDFWQNFMPWSGFSFRIICAAISVLAVLAPFRYWHRKTGTLEISIVLFCFIFSMPFDIYSVALRGYMLSFLMIVLCVHRSNRWLLSTKNKAIEAVLYFLLSLAAVGVIPTNLLPLAAISLFYFPKRNLNKLFTFRYIWLWLAPLLAFIVFYAPIYSNFLNAMKLKEGWSRNLMSAYNVYLAFAVSFLPVLLPALLGLVLYFRRCGKMTYRFYTRVLIFILPLIVVSVLEPAPFPRVFFPLWVLWIYMLAMCMKEFFSVIFANKGRRRFLKSFSVVLCSCIVWAYAQQVLREKIAAVADTRSDLDDYFQPYYLVDFNPRECTAFLKAVLERNPERMVFVSFDADKYSTGFYWAMFGLKPENLLMDGPGFRVASIPANTLLVVRDENDLISLSKRFGFTNAVAIKDFGHQKIYKASF